MSITKKINLTAKESCADALLEVLKEMVVLSKKEQGCLFYALFQEKENQVEFFLIETWANDDVLAAHKITDHFKAFARQAPNLIESKSSIVLNAFI